MFFTCVLVNGRDIFLSMVTLQVLEKTIDWLKPFSSQNKSWGRTHYYRSEQHWSTNLYHHILVFGRTVPLGQWWVIYHRRAIWPISDNLSSQTASRSVIYIIITIILARLYLCLVYQPNESDKNTQTQYRGIHHSFAQVIFFS